MREFRKAARRGSGRGIVDRGRRVLGCAAVVGFLPAHVRDPRSLCSVAKSASKRKEKPAPQPNPEAVARMSKAAAELRAYRDKKLPTNGLKKRSPELEQVFLEGLADGSSVTASAWAVGIDRSTAFLWRRQSEATVQDDGTYTDDFCVRWDEAIRAGVERLEDEAHRRAFHGYERPVYQGGVLVGTTTEYSDTLMTLLLKGKARHIYGDKQEIMGKDGGAIAHSIEVEFVPFEGKK